MLIITNDVAEAIRAQGSAEYPHECCGLLLGTADDPKRTTVAWPVSNAWTQDVALTATEDEHSLRDRFYIPPKAYLQADRAARQQGLDIVGCYHSHPDDRAVLSERDRVGAAGVGGGLAFSFVVISIMAGSAAAITSATLSLDGTHWVDEELQIDP